MELTLIIQKSFNGSNLNSFMLFIADKSNILLFISFNDINFLNEFSSE